jgi:hypothetical protein
MHGDLNVKFSNATAIVTYEISYNMYKKLK